MELVNLQRMVNVKDVTALNLLNSNPVEHLFQSKETIRSDSDEQIIIHFPFKGTVRMHSIQFLSVDADSQAKIIHLYKNKPNINFTDVDVLKPTESIFNSSNKIHPLKFTNFLDVNHLTVFIEDNYGDECTDLASVVFIGQPVDGMDLKKLKKC